MTHSDKMGLKLRTANKQTTSGAMKHVACTGYDSALYVIKVIKRRVNIWGMRGMHDFGSGTRA